jgi:hypothetical protein
MEVKIIPILPILNSIRDDATCDAPSIEFLRTIHDSTSKAYLRVTCFILKSQLFPMIFVCHLIFPHFSWSFLAYFSSLLSLYSFSPLFWIA